MEILSNAISALNVRESPKFSCFNRNPVEEHDGDVTFRLEVEIRQQKYVVSTKNSYTKRGLIAPEAPLLVIRHTSTWHRAYKRASVAKMLAMSVRVVVDVHGARDS